MSKGIFLLIPALFIDGLQALLSLGLMGVFASPAVVPVVGTAVAGVTVPIGIILGFILNTAFALVFGGGLMILLGLNNTFYPRYLFAGGGELIPGLNNLPFWTLFVLLCVMRKNAEEKEGTLTIANSPAVEPAQNVMVAEQKPMNFPQARESSGRTPVEQEQNEQPTDSQEPVDAAKSRVPFQDIRPKSYAPTI